MLRSPARRCSTLCEGGDLGPGLIFHTDRGIEYGAFDYQAALRRHGIVQSMNRPGQMNDNAHMESFFHSLKSEFLWGKQFDSDQELRQTLHTYLQYYNHTRLHSSLEHSSASRLRTTHDLTTMCQLKRSKILPR